MDGDFELDEIESDEPIIDNPYKLSVVRKSVDSSIFNDTERSFIKEIRGKSYGQLSKYEKVVVLRLYGWLVGG